jgi:hypothetical protein
MAGSARATAAVAGSLSSTLEHPFLYLSTSAAGFSQKIAHFSVELRKSG